MADLKATKGPWDGSHGLIGDGFTGYFPIYHKNKAGGIDLICTVISRREDDQAKAHMITAAPDLYEALEAMMSRLELYAGPDDMHAGHHDKAALEQARTALAKARGEKS